MSGSGRKHIHDATAHGEIAGLHDGADARETVAGKKSEKIIEAQRTALGQPQMGVGNRAAGRNTLQCRTDRGDHDARPLDPTGKRRKRGHALGHDFRFGRNPVIRKTIPPRQGQDRQRSVEEPDGFSQSRQPRLVAGDVKVDRAGLSGLLRNHQRIKPLWGAG
jgi:hypothetical protein